MSRRRAPGRGEAPAPDLERPLCAGLGRYSRARALIEQVEAASVDVVICDPPYPREYLDCWSELGEFAARALKPGGLLVALSGQSFLPEVMQRLGQHLRWWWLVHYATPGELGDNRARRVSVTGKPLLVYANGSYSGRVFGDTVRSEKSESQLLHEWGQSESRMTARSSGSRTPAILSLTPSSAQAPPPSPHCATAAASSAATSSPTASRRHEPAGPLSEISISFSLSSRRERRVAAGRAAGCAREPANPHLQRRCSR